MKAPQLTLPDNYLNSYFMNIVTLGKRPVLIYANTKAYRRINDLVSAHNFSAIHHQDMETTVPDVCVYFTLENIRIVGHKIIQLNITTETAYRHAALSEHGHMHIIEYNDDHPEHNKTMCGKTY